MQIWLKSANKFMRYCAHKHLLAQIWQNKSHSDLEKQVKVTKTYSALHHVQMLYPCKFGWNLQTSSWDMVHTSTFCLKFGSLSSAVTLKIRSWWPKPNQLFIMSQCYIHANLVKIHPSVYEISCIQESVAPTLTLTPTPTGSAPKTVCPPPRRWGTKMSRKFQKKKDYMLWIASRRRIITFQVWYYKHHKPQSDEQHS